MDKNLTAIELPLETMPFPDLAQTYAVWRQLCGQRWAPARGDLNPVHLPRHVLPRLMEVDVSHDPLEFSYRYWGPAVKDLHGADMTGGHVRDLRPPAFAELVWRQYADIVERRSAAVYVHEVPTNQGPWLRHAILRLPFSKDGERVDIIVSIDDYSDAEQALKTYYRPGGPESASVAQ